MQQAAFGDKLKDLTPVQESVLSILFLSEKLANYPMENDQTFYASGRFFLYLNGMVFESYHRNLMRQLADLGWIEIITRSGILYYGLTDVGHSYKAAHAHLAAECGIRKIT